MNKKNFALIRLPDIILIAALIFLIFLLFFSKSYGNNEALTAVVYINKTEKFRYDLNSIDKPVRIPVKSNGIHLEILMERGRICIDKSSCPDKICVNTGWLTRKGDKAVCLPARVYIAVTGQKDIDAITG